MMVMRTRPKSAVGTEPTRHKFRLALFPAAAPPGVSQCLTLSASRAVSACDVRQIECETAKYEGRLRPSGAMMHRIYWSS
jgi:hypothetical protein